MFWDRDAPHVNAPGLPERWQLNVQNRVQRNISLSFSVGKATTNFTRDAW